MLPPDRNFYRLTFNYNQVGQILNMSQTGYSQYEIGKNDIPTNVLINLAIFYNVSVDYILGLTDISKPYPRKKFDR